MQHQQAVESVALAGALTLQHRADSIGVAGILHRSGRDLHDMPHVPLTAPMAEEQAQQSLPVDPVRLYLDARGAGARCSRSQQPDWSPRGPSAIDAARSRRGRPRSSSPLAHRPRARSVGGRRQWPSFRPSRSPTRTRTRRGRARGVGLIVNHHSFVLSSSATYNVAGVDSTGWVVLVIASPFQQPLRGTQHTADPSRAL